VSRNVIARREKLEQRQPTLLYSGVDRFIWNGPEDDDVMCNLYSITSRARAFRLLNLINLGQFAAGRAQLDDVSLPAAGGVEGKNLASAGRWRDTGKAIARHNFFGLVAGDSGCRTGSFLSS
jgi:hypothetical protein